MKKFILLLAMVISISQIKAQIMPSARYYYFPKFDSTQKEWEFMNNTMFNSEFLFTWGSYMNEKDRSFRLNGIVEVLKTSNSSVFINLSNELNANTLNDVSFNPRTTSWEENIGYIYNAEGYQLLLGGFHRCKHEVDNSDVPAGDEPDPTYNPEKRIIILSGFRGGVAKEFNISSDFTNKSQSDIEFYGYSADLRTPKVNTEIDWDKLVSTWRFTTRFDYNVIKNFNLYTRANTALYFMNSIEQTYQLELGFFFKGKASAWEVYLLHEKSFDELAFLIPNTTRFTGLGVRLRTNDAF